MGTWHSLTGPLAPALQFDLQQPRTHYHADNRIEVTFEHGQPRERHIPQLLECIADARRNIQRADNRPRRQNLAGASAAQLQNVFQQCALLGPQRPVARPDARQRRQLVAADGGSCPLRAKTYRTAAPTPIPAGTDSLTRTRMMCAEGRASRGQYVAPRVLGMISEK